MLAFAIRRTKEPIAFGIADDGVSFARLAVESGNRIRLLNCEFTPGADDASQLHALRESVQQNHLKGASCISVTKPSDYKLMQVEPPQVSDDELKDALRWRVKDLIDFPPEEAVIDIFNLPEEIRARHNMVHVVAARKDKLSSNIQKISSANLKIDAIDICELALRNISLLLPESADGVAILQLDENDGLIGIFRGGELYLSRRFNTGTSQLIDAANSPNLGSDSDLPPQLTMALDSIVLEIQRSLDYYESSFAQPPINSIVVAPTMAPVAALITYLNSNLAGTARQLDLTAILDWQGELPDEVQSRCLLTVGAALRNLVGTQNAAS